jgi:hypothetical protein
MNLQKIGRQGRRREEERRFAVTSEAREAWYVMLQDEASAGKVVVPLRPFLRFSRRLDRQLAKFERRIREEMPQLARRGMSSERRKHS